MRSIMTAKTPQDSSFSFSRRYFHFKKKVEDDEEEEETRHFRSSSLAACVVSEEDDRNVDDHVNLPVAQVPPRRKKQTLMSVSKLRSALTFSSKSRSHSKSGLGKTTRIVGTLFGHRSGHVHIAFQEDPKLGPAFLVELATPTSFLVREMASGLVRIALECDKKISKKGFKLLEEPLWRTYCNGKKCGYAMRRDCGTDEWKVFNSVGPITMGAGVLPDGGGGGGGDGELMYMRASFERIVGSKDSEAFYMMNPDNNGGPELSIYLIRA
ncbi:hypothetical protein QVD17_18470 [Tagetes erecta]|uniref:Protein MIZU-KUSSEI 1 n=1 Tax=Tagetes erecta TaxID=13708 RepID=A0AAD8KP50_TARER|nr:hypothetical protein QVD17_18470 [Tagetes erecta]